MIDTKDILDAIEHINTLYVEQLTSEVRYERFMDGETKEQWVHLLGPDVLFATHPLVAREIVDEYLSHDTTLSEQERTDLQITALIHDWGELKINGDGIGDVSYSHKTAAHEREETRMFYRVTDAVENEFVRDYFRTLYETIVLDRTTQLGAIFNATERIGYLRTALRAYHGYEGAHITNWKGLTGNVLSNQIVKLIPLSEKDTTVRTLFDAHSDDIAVLLALDWQDIPQDKDGLPTYDHPLLPQALEAWAVYSDAYGK
jgi:5'-deoxynucleotidase YfbR-like HD superfamily hydrolase